MAKYWTNNLPIRSHCPLHTISLSRFHLNLPVKPFLTSPSKLGEKFAPYLARDWETLTAEKNVGKKLLSNDDDDERKWEFGEIKNGMFLPSCSGTNCSVNLCEPLYECTWCWNKPFSPLFIVLSIFSISSPISLSLSLSLCQTLPTYGCLHILYLFFYFILSPSSLFIFFNVVLSPSNIMTWNFQLKMFYILSFVLSYVKSFLSLSLSLITQTIEIWLRCIVVN